MYVSNEDESARKLRRAGDQLNRLEAAARAYADAAHKYFGEFARTE